jgi:hypothetical protein
MQTFSTNSLAEQFEIDRGTMVRALKNVLPDAQVMSGRPTYKVATAAAALEVHRRSTVVRPIKPADLDAIDPRLQSFYDAIDRAQTAMRKLKTLPARRAAAIDTLRPILDETQLMQSLIGRENGGHALEAMGLVSDNLYLMALRGLEAPCQWTMSEAWTAMNVEAE